MENYESVDSFLEEWMEGKSGSVVIYEIHNDGGLGRMKFILMEQICMLLVQGEFEMLIISR